MKGCVDCATYVLIPVSDSEIIQGRSFFKVDFRYTSVPSSVPFHTKKVIHSFQACFKELLWIYSSSRGSVGRYTHGPQMEVGKGSWLGPGGVPMRQSLLWVVRVPLSEDWTVSQLELLEQAMWSHEFGGSEHSAHKCSDPVLLQGQFSKYFLSRS